MNYKNITIGKRLSLGFGVILVFIIVLSVYSLIKMNKLWQQTEQLYKHPFVVSNAVRDVKINMLNIRRYMLNITTSESMSETQNIIKSIDEEEKLAYKSFDTIFSQFLGDKKEIEHLYISFKNWKGLRDDAISDFLNNKTDEAINKIVTKNKDYVNLLLTQTQTLIDFATQKAHVFYDNSLQIRKNSFRLMIALIIISFIICIILAYTITSSITAPLNQVVQRMKEISLGKLSKQLLTESKDEMGQLAVSYNQMQENILHKAEVAEKIAFGNFDIRVLSNGESDIVANSINKIADNFEIVVKQARKVASGIYDSEISEISKSNQLAVAFNQMLVSLREVVEKSKKIAAGDYSGEITPKSTSDELAKSLNLMTQALRDTSLQNHHQSLILSAQNELNELMRGDQTPEDIAKKVITYISKFVGAQIGALYLFASQSESYQLTASYAFKRRKGNISSFKLGEGLIGQAAMEKELLAFSNIPDDYIHITSGLGDSSPKSIIVAPLIYNGFSIGVIEIGALTEFNRLSNDFLILILENIAISIASAQSRKHMAKLLSTTQEQAEELKVQQEELRQSNEELENQTKALKKSEEFLQTQQEELRVINEELEEKTKNLEKQKEQISKQNTDLEDARKDLERKARELGVTNKYKSEFLANMSHELRTPLNSLMILSQNLMENKQKNLVEDQIESARIIYNSGNDLLNLINDILDLSKIESGKVSLSIAPIAIKSLEQSTRSHFEPLIKQKNLDFSFTIEEGFHETIESDEQRLNQIVRNLLSNAIKFTNKGKVEVKLFTPSDNTDLSKSSLLPAETFAISVKDTGIGIAPENQLEIFEAFQQADGSISRNYGGTGLGLSITRELTKLLGGEIKLMSELEKGSEFTIYLPVKFKLEKLVAVKAVKPPETTKSIKEIPAIDYASIKSIPDNRDEITASDNVLLIIEDDNRFASILAEMCQEKGFKFIATATGEDGILLAKKFIPKGIILDINLPGISGWDVLQSLKNTPEVRHIPVHIMSGYEETIDAFAKGAMGYLTKPATKEKLENALLEMQSFIAKKIKDLLVIEDDDNLRISIRTLLKSEDVSITECSNGSEAIEKLSSNHFDCIVLDLGLPDMSGFELLKKLSAAKIKMPPVVVYTGKDISPEENQELQQYTQNVIIKGVKSQERLLDETALFLHRMVSNMPEKQQKMLINLYDIELIFKGKKILLVDDDMRNIFALTQVLESANMSVIMASNGAKAIEQIENNNDIDLVLMDIMMPVMDGLEAMRQIRKNRKNEKLPIIALTAKAMKEDREKSIQAGANDYLSKPVDVQKLLNLMQIWLYK
jgi:CheY-like chemotaxis protein/signal transduction histidine kinase/methyl-accepting chemotaxis protein